MFSKHKQTDNKDIRRRAQQEISSEIRLGRIYCGWGENKDWSRRRPEAVRDCSKEPHARQKYWVIIDGLDRTLAFQTRFLKSLLDIVFTVDNWDILMKPMLFFLYLIKLFLELSTVLRILLKGFLFQHYSQTSLRTRKNKIYHGHRAITWKIIVRWRELSGL